MNAANAIVYAMLVCGAGALATLAVSKNKTLCGWVAFLATAIAGGLALNAAYLALTEQAHRAVTYWALPQLGSALRIQVDGLSAVFVALIAVISILAAFYAIWYMQHYKEYGVARFYPYCLLFIAGMYGIVTTTDLMFFFCAFWQLMTLTSYALVRYEWRKPENVRAAWKYLIMMEIACALIMIGAFVVARASSPVAPITGETPVPPLMKYDFDAIRNGLHGGEALMWGLLLFLLGFGIKAGMWPFGQMWLPDAHPAAPSPVSALLSGVMIKTGIYGLMRSFLWLVPVSELKNYPAAWWGGTLAVLGTITLFIGTMQALKQEQTKRLLAFHSIGQVGYILLGLGACVALLHGQPTPAVTALAALAFYGALFHAINHGLFKSLLFLNAGGMLYATGTQNLNKLGGLMKYMPVTGVLTLIASFSIAGVPLFNGFASKWSIYAATILGSKTCGYLAICAVIALLTSVLTLASFIKFFGASFLSRASVAVKAKGAAGLRRDGAATAPRAGSLESGALMLMPQVVLATLCVMLGVLPSLAYALIHQALAQSADGLGAALSTVSATPAWGEFGLGGTAGYVLVPIVVAVVFALLFGLVALIGRSGGAERRVSEPWLCGYSQEADQNRYGAHHLYTEFKRYFRWVGGGQHEAGSRK